MSNPASPTCCGHRCWIWSISSWISVFLTTVTTPHSTFLPSLRRCALKNIIETVTIAIQVRRIGSYRLLVGNSWGRLDEVLTSPGWFSLKRVSLAIDITRCNSRRLNGLKETLQKLPETHFPRLSSNNPVSFNFKIISKWWDIPNYLVCVLMTSPIIVVYDWANGGAFSSVFFSPVPPVISRIYLCFFCGLKLRFHFLCVTISWCLLLYMGCIIISL